MFSWLSALWSKTGRSIIIGATAALALIGAILWIRDDAADDREKEVRDEHDKNALDQRLEIEETQNDQVSAADDIRRDAEPTDHVPEWMRLDPESD